MADDWRAGRPTQAAGEAYSDFYKREKSWEKSVGLQCRKCSHYIMFAKGYPELCRDCRQLRDSKEEVNSDHAVRCPKCKHEISGDDLYDTNLWEEGDHEVMCSSCEHEFTVETSVAYMFKSPALLKDEEPEPELEPEEEEEEEGE